MKTQKLAISQIHNVIVLLIGLFKSAESKLSLDTPVCLLRNETDSNFSLFEKITSENNEKFLSFFKELEIITNSIISLKEIVSQYNETNKVNSILCEVERLKLLKLKLESILLSKRYDSSDKIKSYLENCSKTFEMDKSHAEENNKTSDKKMSVNFDKSISLQLFTLDQYDYYIHEIKKIDEKIMQKNFELRTANGKPVDVSDEIYQNLASLGVVPKLTK